LFMLNREARFTKYQSQLFQVMFIWLIIAMLQIYLTRELSAQSFIVFIPSLAYLISHYLLLIRRKWIAELMLWFFLIGIISMNLLTRYNRLERVNFEALFPKSSPYEKVIKDKRIMVLADDPAIYQQNQMGGYFLDWSLSKSIFQEPDYYENILLINEAFEKDAPEVIIDPNDLMKNIFDHIPAVKPMYKREGSLYVRVGN